MLSYRHATNLLDIPALISRWQRVLRVERKSPATIRSYTDGVTNYLKWCAATATEPDLSRESVEEHVVAMMEDGAEPASIHSRLKGLRRFTALAGQRRDTGQRPAGRYALPQAGPQGGQRAHRR
jgi:integrase/recombinase XerD